MWRATHTLCYFFNEKEGSVLLGRKKRGFGAGFWNGYGGKINSDESLESGLKRECEEECGLTPVQYQQRARNHFVADGKPLLVSTFVCESWQGGLIETEEMEPVYFAIADLPYEHMWEFDRLWLPRVLSGERLLTHASFDKNNRLIDYNIKVWT